MDSSIFCKVIIMTFLYISSEISIILLVAIQGFFLLHIMDFLLFSLF